MAASGKRALGCLGLIVGFIFTNAFLYSFVKKDFDESRQRQAVSAREPDSSAPIIAVTRVKNTPKAYVLEYEDWPTFRETFKDATLSIPLDQAGQLSNTLEVWLPPKKEPFWKWTEKRFTVGALAEGKQTVSVNARLDPPAGADPEIMYELRNLTYETDGSSVVVRSQASGNPLDQKVHAFKLAFVLNVGLWAVLAALFAIVTLLRPKRT